VALNQIACKELLKQQIAEPL